MQIYCYNTNGNCATKLTLCPLADIFPWINSATTLRYGLCLEASPRLFLIFFIVYMTPRIFALVGYALE